MRMTSSRPVLRLALLAALLLVSCADEPLSSNQEPTLHWVEILSVLNAPVPLREIDSAELHGYLQVVNHRLADSLLLGPETSISLAAFLDDDYGVVQGESVSANGVALKRANSSEMGFFGYAYQSDIPAGATLRWDARMSHDITFRDSIAVPPHPEITNIGQYHRIRAGEDLVLTTAIAPDSGSLYIRIRYDDARNRVAGGDTAKILLMNPLPPLSTEFYVPDDGSIKIPAAALDSLPKNRVYLLTVMRYSYRPRPNSAGARTGMLAVASYELPVFLKQ